MASWNEPKSDYTVSSQVTYDIFNNLAENEKYLNTTKIATNDVQVATVASVESVNRTNIQAQETVSGAFGKIRKWFADLKPLAFKDKVASEDITSLAVDKITGIHAVAKSGSYADLNNKPDITKQSVGLGNVDNIKQFSTSNPPPYPVTSVNGQQGNVTIPTPQVEPNGTYSNMSVGNSQKLGGVDASSYVQLDSPLLSSVKISVIKLNKSLDCTASATKVHELTGELSKDVFDSSKDIFYVTAFSGKGNNFWADMSSGLSYRNGSYAPAAYLNSSSHTKGNNLVDMHSAKVYFNSNNRFYCQVSPSYRFYTGSSNTAGLDRDDNVIIVDLYIIKFK